MTLAPGQQLGPYAIVAPLGGLDHGIDEGVSKSRAAALRALELAPDTADVLRAMGGIDDCLGHFAAAVALIERAIELDPLSVMSYSDLARTYMFADRHAEAEAALRKILDLAPASAAVRGLLALVLFRQGRVDEAVAESLAEPSEWSRLYSLAILRHHMGRTAESDDALATLKGRWAGKAAYQFAMVHAERGEHDAAFEWLDRAIEIRDPGTAAAKVSTSLRSLRTDPRWPALMRRLGHDA